MKHDKMVWIGGGGANVSGQLKVCLFVNRGVLPEKLGGDVRPAPQNPYPI